jgi:Tol biopolymer transport system component
MSIENLGEAINSPTGDGDPYVSPDGKMMIFMSWGREDDLGGGDLYISFKQDGEWSKAKNLGPKINSNQFEYCPMMSPDGKYFFWTSYRTSNYNSPNPRGYQALESRLSGTDNGLGNVYWIDAKVLEEFRD